MHLIGEQDKDFPDYLKELTKPSPAHDISRLAELSRAQGYQGLLRVGVLEVQPKAMKTGMLWFRKMRYFITFGLSLDLYDPFTGAKLLSAIKEETIKIDVDDYEAIRDQNLGSLEDLDEEVVDAAEDLGEQVARTFKSQPWKASVAAVQDGRIFLAVDPQSGLKVGDRLAVFQGRRVIEGPQGEKLIVPGYLVGEIRITGLDDRMAQSAADVQTDIQEGDIAVPVH